MKKNSLLKKLFITLFVFTLVFGITLISLNTFAATEETAQATTTVEKAIDWLKTVSLADLKGWAIGLISYLGFNTSMFVLLAIKLILAKTKEVKQEKFYQELTAKMDEEHKKQMSKLVDSFNKKLAESDQAMKDYIKSQNSEKRQQIKSDVDRVKQALGEIDVKLDE